MQCTIRCSKGFHENSVLHLESLPILVPAGTVCNLAACDTVAPDMDVSNGVVTATAFCTKPAGMVTD